MELYAIVPELILAGLCLALVPVAALVRGRARLLPSVIAAVGLLAALVATARMLPWEPTAVFGGTYAIDGLAHVFKLLALLGALLTVPILAASLRDHPVLPHAPVAILFATLGAVGLASSVDLALIVLFLQLLSMAGYVLAALLRRGPALEAALKYFVYGAVALAVMAYGLTFLYGLTGSLDLRDIGRALGDADRVWVAVAVVLILVGYGFEIAMVPLHPWLPDVLQGAGGPVAGYLSVVPKIAGLAALLRFLLHTLPGELVAWPALLAGASAVTMTFGNLLALRQRRLKRLLAWSSIAQAGVVLMAVAVASRTDSAVPAAGYFLLAYVMMNLGAFAVVSHLESTYGSDRLLGASGLAWRAPGPAAVLALCLLSLAGVPPLAGFAGKVVLLEAALEGGFAWLAVVAAANWVVSLAVYLRVLTAMCVHRPLFFDALRPRAGYTAAYVVSAVGTVVAGVLPAPFLEVAGRALSLVR